MGEANTVGTLPHLPDMYEQFLREIGRGAQFNFWCPSRAIHLARRRRREGGSVPPNTCPAFLRSRNDCSRLYFRIGNLQYGFYI